MKSLRVCLMVSLIAACVALGVGANAYHNETNTGAIQNTAYLEQRISALEQHMYRIESSINRLEQQNVLNRQPAPSTSQRDLEIDLLQRQITTLQNQVNQLSCGLAKLDERTLPANVRD